jgi:hypothetical protein
VLATGKTAPIVWNDGYALGSYSLDKELYTEMIMNRWKQLTKNHPKAI